MYVCQEGRTRSHAVRRVSRFFFARSNRLSRINPVLIFRSGCSRQMLVDGYDIFYRERDMSTSLRANSSTKTATRRLIIAFVIVLVSTGAAAAWRHVGANPQVRYTTAPISRGT